MVGMGDAPNPEARGGTEVGIDEWLIKRNRMVEESTFHYLAAGMLRDGDGVTSELANFGQVILFPSPTQCLIAVHCIQAVSTSGSRRDRRIWSSSQIR